MLTHHFLRTNDVHKYHLQSHNATIMDPPIKAMVMERLQEIGEDTLRERDKLVQQNLLWM